jgi:hypothetical protein
MANNIGTLVAAPIRPASDQDTFPAALANEIMGGLHAVTSVAERDAIPAARRKEGMFCAVMVPNDPQIYQLVGGTGNDHWRQLNLYTPRPDYADVGDYLYSPAPGTLFGFPAPRAYRWDEGGAELTAAYTGETELAITIFVAQPGEAEVEAAHLRIAAGERVAVADGFPLVFQKGTKVRTTLTGTTGLEELFYYFAGTVL